MSCRNALYFGKTFMLIVALSRKRFTSLVYCLNNVNVKKRKPIRKNRAGLFSIMTDGEKMNGLERNIKLIIAYEGTRYAGFQRQKGLPTIQGVLESSIQKLTGESLNITGAGRTDAGVHARGQAVNFRTNSNLKPGEFQKALNHFLPEDIVVRQAEEVPPDFHARYSAKSKTYSYRVCQSEVRPIFQRNFVYHYKYALNVNLMTEAITRLSGTQDFRGFQAAGSRIQNTVRTVHFCDLTTANDEITLIINANGFLYHMVRNIMGALLLIGNERAPADFLIRIIEAKDRSLAGPTAPASGLSLEEVIY